MAAPSSGSSAAAPPGRAGAPSRPGERHRLVDVLRGLALLGILTVNVEFLLQHPDVGWSRDTTAPDVLARWLVTTFAELKVYPVFAMLFGYGISVRVGRARPGARPGRRHARRMLALAVLGAVHAVLFFPGDVLLLYAVVGSLAYLLRHRGRRDLLRLAAVVHASASAVWLAVAVLAAVDGDDLSTPAATASVRALTGGSVGEVVAEHVAQWPGTLVLLVLVQGPAALAAMLVGVALGRTDVLSDPAAHRRGARRVLVACAPLAVVVGGLGGAMAISGGPLTAAGLALGFVVAPATSATYVTAAMLLWVRWARGGGDAGVLTGPGRVGAGAVAVVESAGRTSLSVYLLESVVVSTLSYGYGLGLLGTLGPWGGLLVALAVWSALCLLATAWGRHLGTGPVERVLRWSSGGRSRRARSPDRPLRGGIRWPRSRR